MISRRIRDVAAALAIVCMAAAPSTAYAKQAKIKYAKTEVEKARGKCVAAIIGGALLGGIVGRVAGGKNNTAEGAVLGAAAGSLTCAIIMSNAKRKDRIIAAQIASATYQARPFMAEFGDDNGMPMTFQGMSGQSEHLTAQQLRPVRYAGLDGQPVASPVPEAAGHECRAVNSTLTDASGNVGALPQQYVCRSADGNWHPYGLARA